MEFLSDLVCRAVNQLRYSCCLNRFVEELAKEESSLTATRNGVEGRAAHAKKQTRKIDQVVDKWLDDANIDIDNVNQLLKEARTNWIWRYHLGRKLANKKRDLEKCIEESRQYILLDTLSDRLDFH
ncbi:hypothetical protein CR513_34790, partial [Mucuna pruriens]